MTRLHKPLITNAREILNADPRVLAAWLEGSIARGEDDDYSDIDLWVCVKDARFSSFIDDRERFATQLGSVIGILYPKTLHSKTLRPGDDLDSFRILFEDQPLTMTLDVDVQKQSRKFFFTKDSAAEECLVLFDKANIITYKPFHPDTVEQGARDAFQDLCIRFWMMLPKIIATLARDDLLEAHALYHQRLTEFVTLTRIMYTPEKISWGWKDIEYDLPAEALEPIEEFVATKCDRGHLQKNTRRLAKRFLKLSHVLGNRLRKSCEDALEKFVMDQL